MVGLPTDVDLRELHRDSPTARLEERQEAISNFLVGILKFSTPEMLNTLGKGLTQLQNGVSTASGMVDIWPGFTIEYRPSTNLSDLGTQDRNILALIQLSEENIDETTRVNMVRHRMGWPSVDVLHVGPMSSHVSAVDVSM